MYPAILAPVGAAAVSVGSRLAANASRFIPKFMQQNSAAATTVVARLRGMGYAIGDKVDDVVKWVKGNPVNAAMYAASAASVGVAVNDMFGEDGADPDLLAIQNGHMSLQQFATKIKAADASQVLAGIVPTDEQSQNVAFIGEVLAWARAHYGSVDAAVKAHLLHQSFMELPHAAIVDGYRKKFDRLG